MSEEISQVIWHWSQVIVIGVAFSVVPVAVGIILNRIGLALVALVSTVLSAAVAFFFGIGILIVSGPIAVVATLLLCFLGRKQEPKQIDYSATKRYPTE